MGGLNLITNIFYGFAILAILGSLGFMLIQDIVSKDDNFKSYFIDYKSSNWTLFLYDDIINISRLEY